jgi:hypothetical protein
VKGICIILILTAGKLVTALTASVVSRDTLSVCGKVLEHWKNAVDKEKSWIFIDKEYKNCAKMRHMH